MTYKDVRPIVKRVSKVYRSGVRLTKKAMEEIEAQIVRVPGLEKWFLTIFQEVQMG
jgi:hypothetical protein